MVFSRSAARAALRSGRLVTPSVAREGDPEPVELSWSRKQRRDAAEALGVSLGEVTALGEAATNARIWALRERQIAAEERAQAVAWAAKKGAARRK